MNTASMDTVGNKTKRMKRANKENIECLSEGGSSVEEDQGRPLLWMLKW